MAKANIIRSTKVLQSSRSKTIRYLEVAPENGARGHFNSKKPAIIIKKKKTASKTGLHH